MQQAASLCWVTYIYNCFMVYFQHRNKDVFYSHHLKPSNESKLSLQTEDLTIFKMKILTLDQHREGKECP